MENKVLLQQFEHQVIQTSDGIQIEKRPWSLIMLGVGIAGVGLVIYFLGSLASTEVLLIVLRGLSYLIGILSSVFLLIGLASFAPRFKTQMKIDLRVKKILAGQKTFDFKDVSSLQIVPFGNSFLILQFSLRSVPDHLRILTLPVSKIELLEKLKKDFERIFTDEANPMSESMTLSKNSNSPESFQQQAAQFHKLKFVFTELLGLACAVIFYFAFSELAIRSRYNEGVQIPFWSIGILIMIVGAFNFFKKKK